MKVFAYIDEDDIQVKSIRPSKDIKIRDNKVVELDVNTSEYVVVFYVNETIQTCISTTLKDMRDKCFELWGKSICELGVIPARYFVVYKYYEEPKAYVKCAAIISDCLSARIHRGDPYLTDEELETFTKVLERVHL